MTDYDDPPTENGYYDDGDDTQLYFHAHRERVYSFWRQKASAKRRREQRVESHRITETLR